MEGKMNSFEKYGPWALVAGGSEGLGAAFAEELAGRGPEPHHSFRGGPDRWRKPAARLRAAHGVQVRTLSLDMADPRDPCRRGARDSRPARSAFLSATRRIAYTGPFLRPEFDEYQRILDVNCRCSLGLIHAQARKMAARHGAGSS